MGALVISAWAGSEHRSVQDVVTAVRKLANAGFGGAWVPQTLSVDTLTALAVAGHMVPDISIGTAVVPIQGRHPVPLAQQALAVAQAAGPGRFTLGVGVTHAPVSEGVYGISYQQVVPLCREEVAVLGDLLGPSRRVDHTGALLTARATLMIDAPPPGLVVAALGPQMLELAGSLSDGTVTWMTGPATLSERVVPAIRGAAARSGRPAPRVIAGLPVCVTEDSSAARDRIRPRIEGVARMSSYRRQLALERLDDVADLAVIGTGDEVVERVQALAAIGVTELLADVFGSAAEREATNTLLTSLAGKVG